MYATEGGASLVQPRAEHSEHFCSLKLYSSLNYTEINFLKYWAQTKYYLLSVLLPQCISSFLAQGKSPKGSNKACMNNNEKDLADVGPSAYLGASQKIDR